jgi:SAM-dependent MidA family methyltransferase
LHQAAPALARVLEEIGRSGPLTFARFMEIAQYDPEVGYYAQPTTGPGFSRDYVTSPEIHPGFSVLLAGLFAEVWRILGEPDPFWLVEAGPGTGSFAALVRSAAETAAPGFARALRLALIERSVELRRVQQRRLLPAWDGRIIWLDPDPASWSRLGPGCIFANELLDALPTHRVIWRAGHLRELYVARAAGESTLALIEGEPSTPRLAAQLEAGGAELHEGELGEVCVQSAAWIGAVSAVVAPGYFVLLDYGEPASELYGARFPSGTMRAYSQHTTSGDVLVRAGAQDLTAHVDFSAVTRGAEAAGLTLVGASRQATLLERLGLSALRAAVPARFAQRAAQVAHLRALDALADPYGLGRVIAVCFASTQPALTVPGFDNGYEFNPTLLDTPELWTKPVAERLRAG